MEITTSSSTSVKARYRGRRVGEAMGMPTLLIGPDTPNYNVRSPSVNGFLRDARYHLYRHTQADSVTYPLSSSPRSFQAAAEPPGSSTPDAMGGSATTASRSAS